MKGRLRQYFITRTVAADKINRVCPVPCQEEIYLTDEVILPQSPRERRSTVILFYKSNVVKEFDEQVLFTFGDILASVGGSLGLFLGFSCLGVVQAGIELIPKKA